jgi:hypothetical protein
MNLHELGRRISLLEDAEAIRNLKAEYCLHLDERNTEAAAALFTEDGVWDGGETFGRHEGRSDIAAYFSEIQERALGFSLHHVSNPYVDVRPDGTAFGRWYLFMPCTLDARAVWGAGRYDDRLVKRSDRWLFREMRLVSHYRTPFDRGWAEEPLVDSARPCSGQMRRPTRQPRRRRSAGRSR